MRVFKHHIPTSVLLVVTALLLVALFYGRIVFAPNVTYSGDAARAYLPQRTSLANALKAGNLPWWEPNLGIGYPLLAEGEIAALYPINWVLVSLLPVDISLNVSFVFHILLCGIGMYLWLRYQELPAAACWFGGTALALGGFIAAHNSHLSIISAAAWFPWLLLATASLFTTATTTGVTVLKAGTLALLVALQFYAGHAQVSLLMLMVVALYGLVLWAGNLQLARKQPASGRQGAPWWLVVVWIGAITLGVVLASPQIASGWQLSQLSDRAGGLDGTYFTSFSFHPLLTATFVLPYLQGNPYPNGSIEWFGYIGILPLLLAAVALWHNQHRVKWFLLGMILLGFFLAFGRWNPFYPLLLRLPVFNLFRVPSRFLLWTSVGIAGLAALGVESLLNAPQLQAGKIKWVFPVVFSALLLLVVALVLTRETADELVSLWRWLPVGLIVLAGLMVDVRTWMNRGIWLILAGCLLVVDLYAFNAVLYKTYNTTAPLTTFRQPPTVQAWLAQDTSLYRLYTKEEILPIEYVQKESLYPNYALTYGLASANLYMPLLPANYQLYLERLDAARLDALNVRYYLIPQIMPVDEASELYDVYNPFSNPPYERWLEIEPTDVLSLEIESYLSHSTGLAQGELVAEVVIRSASERTITLPIRAGIESSEWAYERPDVAQAIAYQMAPLASTFPARSGTPAVDHAGHTYLASWAFTETVTISALYIHPILPEAFVRIERVLLNTPDGNPELLSHLLRMGDHRIAFRSEDVLVYRNEDARARAYTISSEEATLSAGKLSVTRSPESIQPADILTYEPQKVIISVNLHKPGYLILADLDYPGWSALIDGVPAPIYEADGVFRAVAVEAGEHLVEFNYHFDWHVGK